MHRKSVLRLKFGFKYFWRQLRKVFMNPIFSVLTLMGNAAALFWSALFYIFEHGVNDRVREPLDAVWWAAVTMTTVGYGDIVPVTWPGRLIAMGLMLSGGVLFLSFIALLSSAFVELEIETLENDIERLEEKIRELGNHEHNKRG